MRARSTISRLASISALVSRASGAISTGNLPSQPLGGAGADRGQALGNALERRQAEPHLEHGGEKQHDGERAEGDDQRRSKAAHLVVDLGGVAGHRDQITAFFAEIDGALDQPQSLILRPLA